MLAEHLLQLIGSALSLLRACLACDLLHDYIQWLPRIRAFLARIATWVEETIRGAHRAPVTALIAEPLGALLALCVSVL